jgi:16S rRNA (guanine966-N2)-methyltransferase
VTHIKISAGFARGMQLEIAAESSTRPTSIKVRQAIANSLQMQLEGKAILDLCAGSGAVGLEFVSRGAGGAVFVETDARAFRVLRKNMQNFSERASQEDLALDPWQALQCDWQKLPASFRQKFDIVWIDPPYASVSTEFIRMSEIAEQCLVPDGLFVMELAAGDVFPILETVEQQAKWSVTKNKSYGSTAVLFFKIRGTET